MAGLVATIRRQPASAAAVAAVLLDLVARGVARGPYPGATLVLMAACGLALLPLTPSALARPTLRAALLPALALAGFAIVLISASIAGLPLTESSIRLVVVVLVGVAVLATVLLPPPADVVRAWDARRELVVGGLLAVVVVTALAASWDIVHPLQVKGTDAGHYLLYAEEAAAQEQLVADDPFAGEERLFADPAAVGAVYASFLILDDASSWDLRVGLVVISAISVLSVFVAAGGLWGAGAGLVAAAAYTVAPIRLDTMYWHGLGTTLALVFVPLVALSLGLMYRGQRDWRVVGLLGLSLVAVAAAHSTTAIVVAVFVAVVPLLDLIRWLVKRPSGGAMRAWWRDGVVRPLLAAVGVAVVLGAGVIAHLASQAADLGRPVDYRFLGPDWLDRAAVDGYFSWRFLLVVAVASTLVLTSRRLRSDAALLSALALVLASVAVTESWRIAFPFEYRRVVYPIAIAMVLVIGAAFLRFRRTPLWIALWVVALLAVAQLSIGLRLPERVLEGPEPGPLVVPALRDLRDDIDGGRLPDTSLVVTDACLHFAVPYLLRRPTIPAFGERQVGFRNRLRLARQASAILEGGREGRRLAEELGVGYVVVDPRCTPDVAARLGGTVVDENDEVVVLRLAGPA